MSEDYKWVGHELPIKDKMFRVSFMIGFFNNAIQV